MNKTYDQRENQGEIWNIEEININAPAPPPPLTEIPQNIPHLGTKTFVGRAKSLQHIDDYFLNNSQIAITSAIQSVDINPPDDFTPMEKVNYCWNHWPKGNVLLIFDDVQNYQLIKPYLPPRNEKFKVIVTSRQRLGKLAQLSLKVLKPKEALELLKQIIGEGRVKQEVEISKQLCKWLGYLPLALELVGRYLETYDTLSIEKVLERLEKKKLQARALLKPQEDEADMTAQLGIASAFELSWEKLSSAAQELGCYLSLFKSEAFDWQWVEASNLYPNENEDKEEQVEELEILREEELRKFNLLQISKEEGEKKILFIYHPLISRYFESKSQELENWEELQQKFCQSMAKVAQSIDYRATQQKIKEFTIAVPHLKIVIRELSEQIEDDNLVWPFIGLGRFYEGQTDYQEAEKWRKKCLAICQKRLGEEHPDVALSLNNLASLYDSQGKYAEAEPLYRQALEIFEKVLGKDHPSTVTVRENYQGLLEKKKLGLE